MTTPAPFGFAPAAVVDVAPAAAAPVAAAPAVPVGALVTWREFDLYDELHPERVRYGVVVAYDEHGAAQILPVGERKHLAHFGPVPADPSQPHGPIVTDLTVVH